ncbi:FKBP-type peptidyl-prolyl cis-trans isomerase [Pyronema omphalodes]|nr:FKBP-type peptidyl-prolyl cis-trans isomerase [Pyronema omphalodes]KAI5814301.1 FKBP-type peptidyl-prolyl cis-trans isomerase [Pyronema omphalodes]
MQFTTVISLFLSALIATATASELKVEKLNEVECKRKTQNGDVIRMDYTGKFEDGNVFDSSVGRSPLAFTLGSGQVIKGWDQGLTEMCPGEKRKLTIPPSLAYGDRGIGPIPGGATLVFDVELVSIDGVKPEKKDEL